LAESLLIVDATVILEFAVFSGVQSSANGGFCADLRSYDSLKRFERSEAVERLERLKLATARMRRRPFKINAT
jgi:hypothetical protein